MSKKPLPIILITSLTLPGVALANGMATRTPSCAPTTRLASPSPVR